MEKDRYNQIGKNHLRGFKMKIRIGLCAFLGFAFFGGSLFAQKIEVVYPKENSVIPNVENTYIFGNVSPSTGTLTINSVPAEIHPGGGFITYIPVEEGKFSIKSVLTQGNSKLELDYPIIVGDENPFVIPEKGLYINDKTLEPSQDMRLSPGDWVTVYAQANPNKKVFFSVKGLIKNKEMSETPLGSGYYYGSYRIREDDEAQDSKVTVTVKGDGMFSGSKKVVAHGKISVMSDGPEVAVVTDETISKTVPSRSGVMMALRAGMKLAVTSEFGGYSKFRLTNEESSWTYTSRIRMLPKGTPIPIAKMGEVDTVALKDSTRIDIKQSEFTPYLVEEQDDSISVKFYYTKAYTEWIVYDPKDTFIKDITWQQIGDDTCQVKVNFKKGKTLWGYDIDYKDGTLSLLLRHPPQIKRTYPNPLSGLKITLDPGHFNEGSSASALYGVWGPTGANEAVDGFKVAKILKSKLENLGADVIMTREKVEDKIALADRPVFAWKNESDLFISMHYDALPEGMDPFAEDYGFSIYYYQPHSHYFAQSIHDSYAKNLNIPDNGLRNGDFLVIRMTQMPSVLLESARIIFPEQEALIKTKAFQNKLADTIAQGILDYFKIKKPVKTKKS
jgi:N-acetylmuramoyl-L-alanine amidase